MRYWDKLDEIKCDNEVEELATFAKMVAPLFRRVYPTLMAQRLVEVQPLPGPVGLVYFLRNQYLDSKSQ